MTLSADSWRIWLSSSIAEIKRMMNFCMEENVEMLIEQLEAIRDDIVHADTIAICNGDNRLNIVGAVEEGNQGKTKPTREEMQSRLRDSIISRRTSPWEMAKKRAVGRLTKLWQEHLMDDIRWTSLALGNNERPIDETNVTTALECALIRPQLENSPDITRAFNLLEAGSRRISTAAWHRAFAKSLALGLTETANRFAMAIAALELMGCVRSTNAGRFVVKIYSPYSL